jgi:prophage maintenance system killer protein
VITLDVADLVVIAGHVLGLDPARVLDLLDLATAEHALAQVRPDDDAGDLARPAAVLLCALVREQPLRRGNQQVALAVALQFLALNGQEMDPGPAEEVAAVVAGAASCALDAAQVADWLAPRLRPTGRPMASVKEEPMRGRPALPLAQRIRKATLRQQPTGTFRRFSEEARRTVYYATEEARLLRHGHVGTEHLLLGLVFEDEGLAAKALESLGLSLAEVRQQVTEITGHGNHAPPRHIPFTPQAKKVLELSLREALSLGHLYIGTEHLLLGLLRVERGIGARVLTGLGAGYDKVRERVAEASGPGAGHDRNRTRTANPEGQQARPPTLAELAAVADQLDQVRARKEAALDAEDFAFAKALRDQERELLVRKTRLERWLEITSQSPEILKAVLTENQQLHRELNRLRGLLRDHGIEPDAGTARPA